MPLNYGSDEQMQHPMKSSSFVRQLHCMGLTNCRLIRNSSHRSSVEYFQVWMWLPLLEFDLRTKCQDWSWHCIIRLSIIYRTDERCLRWGTGTLTLLRPLIVPVVHSTAYMVKTRHFIWDTLNIAHEFQGGHILRACDFQICTAPFTLNTLKSKRNAIHIQWTAFF